MQPVHITPAQIKYIKTLQRAAGLDDDAYREMLEGVAGVKSCKDLTGARIDRVIRHLAQCSGGAPAAGASGPAAGPRMATLRQLFAIRRLWALVSVSSFAEQAAALKKFLKNRYGVEILEWLTFSQAGKVIEGLKSMQQRRQITGPAPAERHGKI